MNRCSRGKRSAVWFLVSFTGMVFTANTEPSATAPGSASAFMPPALPYAQDALENAGKPGSAAVFNNAAQVWNHTFFWQSMKPGKGGKPDGRMRLAKTGLLR